MMAPAKKPAEQAPSPKKDDKKTAELNSNARLIVEVPADAKLFVDDQPMKTNSARRVFNTPTLEEGQAYYYILRAEVIRDGKQLSESKRVIVHAGDVVRTTFSELEPAPATIAEVSLKP